ncbi:MAG: AbrB/MazE/SpoVT family DNA-binding domain-containing protein [Candidatus Micrarchaeota archaeon]|nr:AbrB/MazE/SpoVT family DNA-binding domain-containing protein [Candidatus Micrarchaeota archaeon]
MEMEIELTKTSSKGQVVLPKKIRAKLHIKKGTMFALQVKNKVIMLKKIDNPVLKEDLETLERVQEAWNEIEAGRFHRATKEEFFKQLATW